MPAAAAPPGRLTTYVTQGGEDGFTMSVLKVPKGVKADLDGVAERELTHA